MPKNVFLPGFHTGLRSSLFQILHIYFTGFEDISEPWIKPESFTTLKCYYLLKAFLSHSKNEVGYLVKWFGIICNVNWKFLIFLHLLYATTFILLCSFKIYIAVSQAYYSRTAYTTSCTIQLFWTWPKSQVTVTLAVSSYNFMIWLLWCMQMEPFWNYMEPQLKFFLRHHIVCLGLFTQELYYCITLHYASATGEVQW